MTPERIYMIIYSPKQLTPLDKNGGFRSHRQAGGRSVLLELLASLCSSCVWYKSSGDALQSVCHAESSTDT